MSAAVVPSASAVPITSVGFGRLYIQNMAAVQVSISPDPAMTFATGIILAPASGSTPGGIYWDEDAQNGHTMYCRAASGTTNDVHYWTGS